MKYVFNEFGIYSLTFSYIIFMAGVLMLDLPRQHKTIGSSCGVLDYLPSVLCFIASAFILYLFLYRAFNILRKIKPMGTKQSEE